MQFILRSMLFQVSGSKAIQICAHTRDNIATIENQVCHYMYKSYRLRLILPLIHPLQVISHLKWCIRLGLDLIDLDTRRKFRQCESTDLSVYLEDTLSPNVSTHMIPLSSLQTTGRVTTYQVCNNRTNNTRTRQWQRAHAHNLGAAILGHMVRRHDNLGLVRVRHQVHGTAHTLEHFTGDHVVGQVAIGADLQRAEDGHVDVAAANHAEGFGAVESGGAGEEGDGFFACVDDIAVVVGQFTI